jgi:hypothetical protein
MYNMVAIIAGFVCVLILLFVTMSNDRNALNSHFPVYATLVSITLVFGTLCLSELLDTSSKYTILFLFSIAILIFCFQNVFNISIFGNLSMFLFMDYPTYPGISPEMSLLITLILKITLLFAMIIGLAIIYHVLLSTSYRQSNISGGIIQLLFFIPCLVSDYIKYLGKELNSTQPIVYILLFVEVLLIALYIIIQQSINIKPKYSLTLLKLPTFLSNQKQLGSGNALLKLFHGKTEKLYNYAFSMWINTNMNDADHNYSIFEYGSKPSLCYSKHNTYIFELTDKHPPETYELSMPSQKWNNVVLNYKSSRCDIFINGHLKKTVYFNNENIPFLNKQDSTELFIGEKNDNFHGSICNLVAYCYPLTPEQIANNYNILHVRNPPIP